MQPLGVRPRIMGPWVAHGMGLAHAMGISNQWAISGQCMTDDIIGYTSYIHDIV